MRPQILFSLFLHLIIGFGAAAQVEVLETPFTRSTGAISNPNGRFVAFLGSDSELEGTVAILDLIKGTVMATSGSTISPPKGWIDSTTLLVAIAKGDILNLLTRPKGIKIDFALFNAISEQQTVLNLPIPNVVDFQAHFGTIVYQVGRLNSAQIYRYDLKSKFTHRTFLPKGANFDDGNYAYNPRFELLAFSWNKEDRDELWIADSIRGHSTNLSAPYIGCITFDNYSPSLYFLESQGVTDEQTAVLKVFNYEKQLVKTVFFLPQGYHCWKISPLSRNSILLSVTIPSDDETTLQTQVHGLETKIRLRGTNQILVVSLKDD